MKKNILIILFNLLISTSYGADILKIKLFDGEILTGKLQLPANEPKIKELVIFVHGTGPNTYLNHRKIGNLEFNYYDVFAEEFNRRGIAFFSYNKRGVEISDEPPNYDKIDREKFRKVIPSIDVKDISTIIKFLRKDSRLKKAKIILLGWSEGTIIASMVAEHKDNKVAALLLAGYTNENMMDIIRWQNEGESSVIGIRSYFDKNNDDRISREEYESTEKSATAMRVQGLGNAKFEDLDINKDNYINKEDFKILRAPGLKMILEKIEAKDEDWIWQNYFRISIPWLTEHAKLEPNKTRLLRLKIPIYIFQGEDDANCDVNGVYDVKARFVQAKKN